MLTLVTSNPAKYEPFAKQLAGWRIGLEPPKSALPELQGLNFEEALAAKARAGAEMFGRPVLVDDAGLVLEAYQPFPGPLTSSILPSIGVAGLKRLLTGVSDRASMECHLGCWIGGALRSWSGKVAGRMDFSKEPRNDRMILSDLFVADALGSGELLPHRARALAALWTDVWQVHLDIVQAENCGKSAACPGTSGHQCPFCTELEDPTLSIFAEMIAGRLESRVVYEDEDFVLVPPLGQFTEGGLLLLTREHLLSCAQLSANKLGRLERLLEQICESVQARWGVSPLVFEHGPALQRSKGVCCVDHAHLNIFPTQVEVRPHLGERMDLAVGPLTDLARLRGAEFGYLFIQENDGTRRAYDAQDVPTQLVRRIITCAIGYPERWHWRDYPGYEELIATYHALKGQIRL